MRPTQLNRNGRHLHPQFQHTLFQLTHSDSLSSTRLTDVGAGW